MRGKRICVFVAAVAVMGCYRSSGPYADVSTDSGGAAFVDMNAAIDTSSIIGSANAPETVSLDEYFDTAYLEAFDSDAWEKICSELSWPAGALPVNMLVLLDRSLSTVQYVLAEGEFHSIVIRSGLYSMVRAHTDNQTINFSLNVFPSPVSCPAKDAGESLEQNTAANCAAASQFVGPDEPYLDPLVPFLKQEHVTSDALDRMRTEVSKAGHCGTTPIAKSLQWAGAYLDSVDFEVPPVVLMFTDGVPSCNLDLDIDSCESAAFGAMPSAPEYCLDFDETANALRQLREQGSPTFIVTVGEKTADFSDVWHELAYYGLHTTVDESDFDDTLASPSGSTWHYQVQDRNSLDQALRTITYGLFGMCRGMGLMGCGLKRRSRPGI